MRGSGRFPTILGEVGTKTRFHVGLGLPSDEVDDRGLFPGLGKPRGVHDVTAQLLKHRAQLLLFDPISRKWVCGSLRGRVSGQEILDGFKAVLLPCQC
jgi:hypothetical protein